MLSDAAARREADDRVGDRLHPKRSRGLGERRGDVVVERHMGQGFALARLEAQMLEPHRVAHRAVGDRHAAERLRQRLQRFPGADALEKAARAFRNRDCAQSPVAPSRTGIDDHHRGAPPHRLFERGGERQPHRPGARHENVEYPDARGAGTGKGH